jgi:hypothetical protein
MGQGPATGERHGDQADANACLNISIASDGVSVPGDATLYFPGLAFIKVGQIPHLLGWKFEVDLPSIRLRRLF